MKAKATEKRKYRSHRAENSAELTRSLLLKLLEYRAGEYIDASQSGELSLAAEDAFDKVLMSVARRLKTTFQINDNIHGSVEVFDPQYAHKSRRFMSDSEWLTSRKVNPETLRFFDAESFVAGEAGPDLGA